MVGLGLVTGGLLLEAIYRTKNSYFGNGTKVYNNPQCLETGSNLAKIQNRSTYVQNLAAGSSSKFFGMVSPDGYRLTNEIPLGTRIPAGTVLYFGFEHSHNELVDPTDFAQEFSNYWVGFIKTTSDNVCVSLADSRKNHELPGFIKLYQANEVIAGDTIRSARYAVRPAYDFETSTIAFTRDAMSDSSINISSSFGELPKSTNYDGDSVKSVVKSSDLKITDQISDDKISTEKNDLKTATYSNRKIKVPYASQILTLKPEAFSTSNATHISALAACSDGVKYALLGTTKNSFEIDLSSILNTKIIGSAVNLSFYAEQVNGSCTSDQISNSPVTIEIEVVDLGRSTIVYNAGGGEGSVPQSASVTIGKSYSMDDGSLLSKDGNAFSSWLITYSEYGTKKEVEKFVKSGESIIVPYSNNGTVTATATYSAMEAKKTTDTKSSIVVATWDTNAPEGVDDDGIAYSAKFDVSLEGQFSSDRTRRFDKTKLVGSTLAVPAGPTNLSFATYIFDGWYTDPVNGTRVTGTVSPTNDVTYYAHWINKVKVIYNTGSTGAFSDGSATIEELVTPGEKMQGPMIDGSVATPVFKRTNSNGEVAFQGWFTETQGRGEEGVVGSTEIHSTITYTAYFNYRTFLASASSDLDPRKLSNTITVKDIKNEADLLRDSIVSGESSEIYNPSTDKYHLFTLLKSIDGDYINPADPDSWAEFRIVHTGQHDDDGSGITFQAIHMLPIAFKMNSTNTNSGYWGTSELCAKLLEGGEIYNMFDSSLMSKVVDLPATDVGNSAKHKLWIPSYSELTGESLPDGSSDGTQFTFWQEKYIEVSNANDSLKIIGRRSGNSVSMIYSSGNWWMRSPFIGSNDSFMNVNSKGSPDFGTYASRRLGVVLCFSL